MTERLMCRECGHDKIFHLRNGDRYSCEAIQCTCTKFVAVDPVPTPKFRQIRHRNESGELVAEVFARDDNGMIVGAAEVSGLAKFGEDPEQITVRAFVSREFALDWIKLQCKQLAGREDVDFLVEESGSGLVVPARKAVKLH
jgi:hypothetical protein